VDLYQVAREIGVREIRQVDSRNSFTSFGPARPVIYLNYLGAETRRRFVLAHEISHVMLRTPEVTQLMSMTEPTVFDEEDLADRIARTLLVPDSWVDALRERRSLEWLEDIARQADVPLTELIRRMTHASIDVALLHWRRADYVWHVIDRPGAPPSLQGHVKPSPSGHQAIESLRHRESNIIVSCLVNNRQTIICGTAHRRGRHVLQLIEPARDVQVATPENQARRRAGRHSITYPSTICTRTNRGPSFA
jgi:hypothetical protein